MPDVATVKRAVRALAEDAPERRGPPPIVADAGTALADVRRAARFVADGGESRLREAVGEAERRGDLETVREGRRALDALSRLRERARSDWDEAGEVDCGGNDHVDSDANAPTDSETNAPTDSETNAPTDSETNAPTDSEVDGAAASPGDARAGDHFHRARGTVLGGGGQCPER
ncbi:MAG: hypothetical protein ABEJ22_08835 [Haloferacaceae archaeon]